MDVSSRVRSPFELEELVLLILRTLSDDPPSLAACCRVNKTWNKEAIKLLYSGGPMPLMTLLTSHLGDETATRTEDGMFGFDEAAEDLLAGSKFIRRPPSPEECAKLRFYGGLVKWLRIGPSDLMLATTIAGVQWDSLETLEIMPTIDNESVLAIYPFLKPTVKNLSLVLDSSDDDDDLVDDSDDEEEDERVQCDHFDSVCSFNIINYSITMCPYLTHLSIVVGKPISSNFIDLLLPLKQTLEVFSLVIENTPANMFVAECMENFNGFHKLRELNLHMNCLGMPDIGPDTPWTPHLNPPLDMPALTDLKIMFDSESIPFDPLSDGFLHLFPPNNLKSLTVALIDNTAFSVAQKKRWLFPLFGSIARFKNIEKFEFFSTGGESEFEDEEDGGENRLGLVDSEIGDRLLMYLTKLKHLVIDHTFLCFNKKDIDELVQYIPMGIQSLVIRTDLKLPSDLDSILHNLPDLTRLVISPVEKAPPAATLGRNQPVIDMSNFLYGKLKFVTPPAATPSASSSDGLSKPASNLKFFGVQPINPDTEREADEQVKVTLDWVKPILPDGCTLSRYESQAFAYSLPVDAFRRTVLDDSEGGWLDEDMDAEDFQ